MGYEIFKKDFIDSFLERGREALMCERYMDQLPLATQVCALTENQTGDPLVCKPAPYPLIHTSQGWVIRFQKCKWEIYRKLKKSATYVAGKSLLGDSETPGHSGYLANRHLPEALLYSVLNSN